VRVQSVERTRARVTLV